MMNEKEMESRVADNSFIQIPRTPDELNAIGAGYHVRGQFDVARYHYDAALLGDYNHPLALQNLSGCLLSGRLHHAALSIAKRAMKASPGSPGPRINHAAVLFDMGRFEESLKEVNQILDEFPDLPGVWHNKGLILNYIGRPEEGEVAFRRALELKNNTVIRSDLALTILMQGRFVEGLDLYSVRFHPDDEHPMKLYRPPIFDWGIPEWKGEDLTGKKLFVVHEQGFGDSIMLFRFCRELAKSGVNLAILVPSQQLSRLFGSYGFPVFDWLDESLKSSGADYFISMLSLPGVMGKEPENINSEPYLDVPEWGDDLPKGFRIGLCWSSGDHNFALAHRRRYVPLESFFPLSELDNVRLISLQKGEPEKDILNLGAESFIHNPMPKCEDFYDTARVIKSLDLVISVDSSVAHLAGALGKQCLMLGPYVPCWRWWGGNIGWPWYENFDIYNQTKYNDWTAPVGKIISVVEDALEVE